MNDIPAHVSWLYDTGERQFTACGHEIEIWELAPEEDEAILSAWAKHFRQHYISDANLPDMVDGTGLSHADYLRKVLFPDGSQPPGPSLRSGDFGEILVADYAEYVLALFSLTQPSTISEEGPIGSDEIGMGRKRYSIRETPSQAIVVSSQYSTTTSNEGRALLQ